MKILYLHNAPADSEMANLVQVKAMAKAMGQTGADVTLSLIEPENGFHDFTHIQQNGAFKLDIRKRKVRSRRLNKYLNYNSVKNTIKKYEPDVCYLRSPLLLKQVLYSGNPVVMELHNNTLHQRFKFLDNYWRSVLRKAVENGQVKRVVCISEALKKYWTNEGLPVDKVISAHDGIDLQQFEHPLTQKEARKRLNIDPAKKVITYAGRLYQNRKPEHILHLAQRFPECQFFIVGGPDERSEFLNQHCADHSITNVELTGQIPHHQVADYLYASDILLALWSSEVPTINYCSPLKVFEYMAAGRVIVAHGFPTIKEVLEHNKTALLCEPDNLNDLIKKTELAIQLSGDSEIGSNARTEVISRYSWQKRASIILSNLN